MQSKLNYKLYGLSAIIYLGSMWGITEATVGYLLHRIPYHVHTGTILFPIGYYFMMLAYRKTGELKAIFLTSIVAASVKLVNLLMPMLPIVKVLNPAGCIILEGLAVVAVFKLANYVNGPIKFIYALIMSLSWRVGYYLLCFALFIPQNLMSASSILSINHFMEFFVLNGLINSAIIYFYAKASSKMIRENKMKVNLPFSTSALLLAIFIQYLVSL